MSQLVIQNIVIPFGKVLLLFFQINLIGFTGTNDYSGEHQDLQIETLFAEQRDIQEYYLKKQKKSIDEYKSLAKLEERLNSKLEFLFLEDEYRLAQVKVNLKIIEFKYRRGIEIIKLIYEKILALDHHFTSLNTFQQINSLSNPNSYPEFVRIKEKLKENSKKKSSIDLPELLENNSLVSLSYSVVSSLFGSGNRKEREKELEEISCLLDFTVSMQSDLKIIYYETNYLKLSNLELKDACSSLFKEYTKVASYFVPLEQFRGRDDWDNLNNSVQSLVKELNEKLETGDPLILSDVQRKLNNLEFSITRLLRFINAYDEFINQGEKYYQKFLTILSNYKYRETCTERLPAQYIDLEKEIKNSIIKFKSAYRIAELQGTKLRDLLYGVPQ